MTDENVEKPAQNQVLFRVLNEKLKGIAEGSGTPPGYVCECGRGECVDAIEVTQAEYAEVRSHPAHFAIKPGHDFPAVEQIVRGNGRFSIVEKVGRAAEIASRFGSVQGAAVRRPREGPE